MILAPELIEELKGAVEDCGFASIATFIAMSETVDHWRKRAEDSEAKLAAAKLEYCLAWDALGGTTKHGFFWDTQEDAEHAMEIVRLPNVRVQVRKVLISEWEDVRPA